MNGAPAVGVPPGASAASISKSVVLSVESTFSAPASMSATRPAVISAIVGVASVVNVKSVPLILTV
jgi:hypothetical protein